MTNQHLHQIQGNRINPAQVLLLISLLLSGLICLTNLLVILTYLLQGGISPLLFPAAVMLSFGITFALSARFGFSRRTVLTAFTTALIILIAALGFAWFYFDLSWDGQWYQQSAVYFLASHWNPLYHPLDIVKSEGQSSILHFPKSTWYFAAAVSRTFGNVEPGKAYNIIVLFAAFGPVYLCYRQLRLTPLRAAIATVLILLNPVVWSELTTYLNDGDLYLLLTTYLAATLCWLWYKQPLYLLVAAMAICCLCNTKFTGLVFFLLSALFVSVYVLVRHKKSLKTFLSYHLAAFLLAICIFGFNPYITNLLSRGNPLYPILGSAKYPSVLANGQDDNEQWETPHNMQGKSLPVRLFYSNFGRPGNAPYNGDTIAHLANPLIVNPASWNAYQYHETRVSGFGPYFGIALLISIVTLVIYPILVKPARFPVILFLLALCCGLALSRHFWWPRFFPVLWLLPILALTCLWQPGGNRFKRYASTILMLLMFLNGLIVSIVHLRWETFSSQKLRENLRQLHDQGQPVSVDYGWFKTSIEEKFKHWQIPFKPASLNKTDTSVRSLPSVVEGYPNTVLYRQERLKKP